MGLISRYVIGIAAMAIAWPCTCVHAGLIGPGNYEECLETYDQDTRARWFDTLVARSCLAKFPRPGEEDPSVNVDYYDCILKRLPEIDSILAVSGVQSACEKEHGPKRDEAMRKAGLDQGKVLQAEQAGQYVYLQVDKRGEMIWIAGVADVKVGDIVGWSGASLMEDYHSKSLNRTFKELYFVSKIELIQ